ncbi:MAG: hypothetical protein KJN62_00070, partial [Deltaproteobacteria bacterium]|nr:hypothetical protein [Deltaproteobacteria bacterium]
LQDVAARLQTENFGHAIDGEAILRLPDEISSSRVLGERVHDRLATTIVGLYDSLKNFYLRTGEGRVDCIKAIIEAERAARTVTDVIVFDAGRRIRWHSGTAVPGYSGVGGLFAQILGDRRFTPIAVLSSEIYMPWNEKNPLPLKIADFIKKEIMLGELSDALFGMVTQGLDSDDSQHAELHRLFSSVLKPYVLDLTDVHAHRPGEFERTVLRKFRRTIRRDTMGITRDRLLARLNRHNHHLRRWIETFFDYAMIATYFLEAHTAELQQVSGSIQKFYVVKMTAGKRKQLMYDLTARIVDAEKLPINMVIVSPWARTGWNVIKPNVLIDATATRNVTAWQQLRGRAMRSLRSWDNDCYRLIMRLLGSRETGREDNDRLIEDAAIALEELYAISPAFSEPDDKSMNLLLEAHSKAAHHTGTVHPGHTQEKDSLAGKIQRGTFGTLTAEEREQLAVELMMDRNKVTHIYEMLKAYGSLPQVRYDQATKAWHRTDSIAVKHAHEYSVSPLSGKYGSGEEHTPLIYFRDPRTNVPSQLKREVTNTIKNRDPVIVKGWLHAVTAGIDDSMEMG